MHKQILSCPRLCHLLYKVCCNIHHSSYQQQQEHRAICWTWLMYLTQKGYVMQNIALHANPIAMLKTKFRRRGNQHLFISAQNVALVKKIQKIHMMFIFLCFVRNILLAQMQATGFIFRRNKWWSTKPLWTSWNECRWRKLSKCYEYVLNEPFAEVYYWKDVQGRKQIAATYNIYLHQSDDKIFLEILVKSLDKMADILQHFLAYYAMKNQCSMYEYCPQRRRKGTQSTSSSSSE